MQDTHPPTARLTIGHLTDLHDEELPAFVHAVALARCSQSKLLSIHSGSDPTAVARMPSASNWLTCWEKVDSGTERSVPEAHALEHQRIVDDCCDDPVDTLVRALKQASAQLVVAATRGRGGLSRAMFDSVAEAVVLHLDVPTLLLPVGCNPFVSEHTGKARLNRILVAAGDTEAGHAGAVHAAWLADLVGANELEITCVRAGDGSMPTCAPPQRKGVHFTSRSVQGSVDQAVPREAARWAADLVVMATRGHDSLRDVLFGSHTERVLHHATCPLLIVPLR